MDGSTSYIEASIDFLICDDICVPEKALIQTGLDDIPEDPSLNRWYEMVPSTVLPTLVEIKDKFINIRFSNNEEINSVYFYIDKQNIVDHAAKQMLEKEKNNWLLQVPLINNHEEFNNLNGVLSINDSENYLVETNLGNNSPPKSSINFLQALFLKGL